MTSIIVGGLRARLIHDSMYHMIHDSLNALGWFNTGRRHKPIQVLPKALGIDEEVPLNTIAIADLTDDGVGAELGSNATVDTWVYYIDFFAEDDSLGKHVIHDIKDILRGKMPSIGRQAAILDVYDWRQNPPTPLFFCDLGGVVTDRAHNFPHLWQRHWFTCRVDVEDAYENDAATTEWQPLP